MTRVGSGQPTGPAEGYLRLRYFAWLREELGRSDEPWPLPQPADLEHLVDGLRARGPQWAAAFAAGRRVRAAVNQHFVGPGARISAGDEIAFFPPVTGG